MVELETIQKISAVFASVVILLGLAISLYQLKLQRQNNLEQNRRIIDLLESINNKL